MTILFRDLDSIEPRTWIHSVPSRSRGGILDQIPLLSSSQELWPLEGGERPPQVTSPSLPCLVVQRAWTKKSSLELLARRYVSQGKGSTTTPLTSAVLPSFISSFFLFSRCTPTFFFLSLFPVQDLHFGTIPPPPLVLSSPPSFSIGHHSHRRFYLCKKRQRELASL